MADILNSPQVNVETPTGDFLTDPSSSELEGLLEETDSTYWKSGSGALIVERETNEGVSLMTATRRLPYGFHITYLGCKGGTQYYCRLSSDYSTLTSIYRSGGDYFKIPVALFVPQETAWECLKHFIATGLMSPSCEWTSENYFETIREDTPYSDDEY